MRGHRVEEIDIFRLTDVLNFLYTQKRTGKLLINGEGHSGEVFFVDGRITHALLGPYIDLDALFFMLSWTTGDYNFTPGESTDNTTIKMETSSILSLMSQRMQEWNLMEEGKIAKPNSVLRLLPQTRGSIRLRKEEWEILTRIDGKKTLKQISDELYIAPFDLARKIQRFMEAGLIGEATLYPEAACAALGEEFLVLLEQELRLAIGPMAPMLMEEALGDLSEGAALLINNQKAGILLEKLSNAIHNEEKKTEFQKAGISLAKKFGKTGEKPR